MPGIIVGIDGSDHSRLLMGSVSTQVTFHTRCPVVVIPANDA